MFGGGDKGNSQTALLQGVMGMLGGSGINGLIGKFDSIGLGDKARSWVGDGPNEPVSGDQVRQAFGDQEMTQIAEKAGLSTEDASNQLAEILPGTVNELTPGGVIPDQDQLKQQLKSVTDRFAA
jgi:uncharacterized protein YidB (DUF937 family)